MTGPVKQQTVPQFQFSNSCTTSENRSKELDTSLKVVYLESERSKRFATLGVKSNSSGYQSNRQDLPLEMQEPIVSKEEQANRQTGRQADGRLHGYLFTSEQ
ncbi:hypothetical protein EOD39_21101 [Acipenser ruthenus]|uniref:Uncharacterized protein n=1 Tax=Acipenser ruthenus TaxID=7906 RepID=A0A444UTL9_ACIRT|nr:hypothetical protein EOD39_21101 [Acipenser ruthenus]